MGIREKAQDMFQAAAEQGPDIVSALMLDGVAGTVVPGVSNAMLAYRQKRQERMYVQFMEEVRARTRELEERLEKLSAGSFSSFKDKYFGFVSDCVLEETQDRKIHYLVNGLINLASMEEVNEDFVLTYYDTLRSMRMLDILVLRRKYDFAYTPSQASGYSEFVSEIGIDDEQYRSILDKLERLGLLTTTRAQKEDDLYRNLSGMQEYITALDKYLEQIEKGKTAKKKTLPRFKRLERTDSFKVSQFGREFVRFFSDK